MSDNLTFGQQLVGLTFNPSGDASQDDNIYDKFKETGLLSGWNLTEPTVRSNHSGFLGWWKNLLETNPELAGVYAYGSLILLSIFAVVLVLICLICDSANAGC